jgi:2-oxo-4-hydroxy-4-carboxy-5-ureidoimidazoline decarboxylase
MATLTDFNVAPGDAATRDALACCESTAFARLITDGRPYPDTDALYTAIDTVFMTLTWDDIVEAMDAHPRIGDRTSGQPAAEQAGAATAGDDVRQALAAGNATFEERFGHVFLICASGLSGQGMLTELHRRLGNDLLSERAVARQELAKITRLRMQKLLSL